MRFVAINTAGPIIEIAVCHDEKERYSKLDKVMAAEQLLPMLDEMLDEMKLELSDFDDFVCTVGPGSFTGIRIGVNTVRSFAYALNKNAYGVTYNRILAYSNMGRTVTFVDGGGLACYMAIYDGDETVSEPICIYKKDCAQYIESGAIADFKLEGTKIYDPDGSALIKAARYAINNKLGTDPLYIRKPQPERKGSDI